MRAVIRKMSTFKQILNPITGSAEWQLCENYDYHQEIARSGFADMLHDTERNQKYYLALKKAIDTYHHKGMKANVLDIGTGTGILSMMAVKCGADSVTACEAFTPMADCAEKIIAKNNMSNLIKIIKKRSTNITVGDDGDMKQLANILVTEVFDTELIGEGALSTFNHAHKCLLDNDCIVVPDSATIFIQVVESPFAKAWNNPNSLANLDGEIIINIPQTIRNCTGSTALHDVQLNQLDSDKFRTIIEPTPVFHFDWSGQSGEIPKTRSIKLKCTATRNGIAQVVFMWWNLHMDRDNEIILSCAPYWDHPNLQNIKFQDKHKQSLPWRDHWMQAIYYFPQQQFIKENQSITINCNHDEYSLWFNIDELSVNEPPICTCGFHLSNSRTRIGQLNDNIRNKKYLKILENEIDSASVVLNISDGSMFGLVAGKLGAKHVYYIESNKYSRSSIKQFIDFNDLKNVTIFENINDIPNISEITHIVSEPSFISSILPWDNFYFATLLKDVKDKFQENIKILPMRANIYAVPVEFLDLHKIRTPLGTCEGFDLDIFDKFVENSAEKVVALIEPQPLWEYPCKALGCQKLLFEFDFKLLDCIHCSSFELPIEINGNYNGIALWVDWHLDDENIVTCGPIAPIEINEFIKWDIHTRQGVCITQKSVPVDKGNVIIGHSNCNILNGEISFQFNLE